MQYIWCGVFALLGWMASYLFARQLIFNFTAAFPLLKGMTKEKEDLIDMKFAKRYTMSSIITCAALMILVSFVCIYFPKSPWNWGAYIFGAVVCLLMLIGKLTPNHRNIFDSFCGAYFRFVPDDELRTAMYNLKPSVMKLRLHDLGLDTSWIPEFIKEDN